MTHMDPLVHFELPVDDMARAKKFYSSIFGWKLDDWKMPDGSVYVGAHTTAIDEKTRVPNKPGAINGALVQRSSTIKAPIFAIHVDSIDSYTGKIEAAGGSVVMPKVSIMGMGYYAYLSDSEGNTIGLWEDAKKE
jgi:uncharacterized protein